MYHDQISQTYENEDQSRRLVVETRKGCLPFFDFIILYDEEENSIISGYTNLTDLFNTSKNKVNILVDMIVKGYAGAGVSEITDAASAAATVTNAWDGAAYLMIKEGAWENLQDYYKSLK